MGAGNGPLSSANRYASTDIWRIRLDERSAPAAFGIRCLRVVLLVIKGFREDRCIQRASSLTFYTLLSIVPVAAMAFGIAKGFGFERTLERQVYEWLAGWEEVAAQVVALARSFLDTVQGGVIAGAGLVLLLWTVIRVLSNIETALNDIWQVSAPRSLGRKFSDYLAFILISPIMVLLSSSVTVMLTSQVALATERFAFLSVVSPVLTLGFKLIPYLLVWLLLTAVYVLMPNTKVRLIPGLLAGVIAGTGYQLAQWAYITFQLGASKYNAIYGSFAALPLFLIWLQTSWVLVLIGAEISYAVQNVDAYEFGPDSTNASPAFRKLVALRILHLVVQRFSGDATPLTAEEISGLLKLPLRLTRLVIGELLDSGVIVETTILGARGQSTYVPGRDTDGLTVSTVIQALEDRGIPDIPMDESTEEAVFLKVLDDLRDALERSPANIRVKDIRPAPSD
ncbi:MAG: YihY/virulence factor BrkB family protein [Desulfobacterales bacterium]|jgi:membrane protein